MEIKIMAQNIIKLFVISLVILGTCRCGSGLDRYVSYEFYMYEQPNELIGKIQNFKKENKVYDVFEYAEGKEIKSVDSICYNGLYDTYDVNLYLPKTSKRVLCSIICQNDTVEYVHNTLYVISYIKPQKPNSNISNENWTIFPKSKLTQEQKEIKSELESVLRKIGEFREK